MSKKEIKQKLLKTGYYMIFLGVTAMLVTAVAWIGYNVTEPVISANLEAKIESNIALLYSPEDGYTRNPDQVPNGYRQDSYDINAIYEVLDGDGNIYVLIYDITKQGRNDDLSALIAVNPYTDTVDKLTYYYSAETPNIGERYTREEEITKLIGQPITGVVVDEIAGATTTWGAIDEMFTEIALHYTEQNVHEAVANNG